LVSLVTGRTIEWAQARFFVSAGSGFQGLF
jgi:hypothetical protein